MRVFIFGANGMLGSYLTSRLAQAFEVIPLTRSDLDIGACSEAEIKSFIFDQLHVDSSDVIVNASGIIKQRDFDLKELIVVNSVFPNILAAIKKLSDCKVIHITTDCVYSGLKGSYIETDLHDCIDEYGKSKSLGENPTLTTIRTSIIGEEKHNKKSLIEWCISKAGSEINGFKNHYWNGISCLELSKLIEKVIKENLFWNGVRHVHSPNTVSKYELVNIINNVYKLDLKIGALYVNYCNRSLSSVHDTMISNTIETQLDEQSTFYKKDKNEK